MDVRVAVGGERGLAPEAPRGPGPHGAFTLGAGL